MASRKRQLPSCKECGRSDKPLLRCSECKHLFCCGEWLPPCRDRKHQGPNERFCYDCTLPACSVCCKHSCLHCFVAKETNTCRDCTETAARELAEFDRQ